MKNAVVIGGSNGIGLTVVKKLLQDGYYVYVLDLAKPDSAIATENNMEYIYCNLLYFDADLFHQLANNSDIQLLFISAGLGRVANFEYIHFKEIQNLMTINATSLMKIISIFYNRIKSHDEFICGVMGSIAGLISSPLFSVYAASKAAVCRFIESVNVELAVDGFSNRILNVSPGSIKGTRFNGGMNDLSLTLSLADEIIEKMKNHSTLFIPEYDEVFSSVLKRYHDDPEQFGISSYEFKKNNNRINNQRIVRIGYLSGTFDLFHVGHLNLLERAKQYCDYLIVGVHPNASHKGKETFIPFEERKCIVAACKYVDKVVDSTPEDSDAWDLYHYNRLFVGSDYKGTERFNRYEAYFSDKGVEIVYFPYTKGTSSTQLREKLN